MRLDICDICNKAMYFSPVEINDREYRAHYCIHCDGRNKEPFLNGTKAFRLVLDLKTRQVFPAEQARKILEIRHRVITRTPNAYFVESGPPRQVGPQG